MFNADETLKDDLMEDNEKKIDNVDSVIENISHNRMLVRNWERMKLLMEKKRQKDRRKAEKDSHDPE